MRLIILTGWSQSGKDTVADILVDNYGFTKYAIADPLKDLCAELYEFPREMADTQEGKRTLWTVGYKTKTIRELLLDTAKMDRSRFGDDIYINKVLTKVETDKRQNIVISDLRYFTELTPIKEFAKVHGTTADVWKIVRNGQVISPVDDESEYILETLKPKFILQNPGTSIEALEERISEYMNRKDELPNPQNEDDGCSIM
jgi:hypothetical protein